MLAPRRRLQSDLSITRGGFARASAAKVRPLSEEKDRDSVLSRAKLADSTPNVAWHVRSARSKIPVDLRRFVERFSNKSGMACALKEKQRQLYPREGASWAIDGDRKWMIEGRECPIDRVSPRSLTDRSRSQRPKRMCDREDRSSEFTLDSVCWLGSLFTACRAICFLFAYFA